MDASVHRACVRHHEDIASDFLNNTNSEHLLTIFLSHPRLRERILRRKDLDRLGGFSVTIKEFNKFQNKLQKQLEAQHQKVG